MAENHEVIVSIYTLNPPNTVLHPSTSVCSTCSSSSPCTVALFLPTAYLSSRSGTTFGLFLPYSYLTTVLCPCEYSFLHLSQRGFSSLYSIEIVDIQAYAFHMHFTSCYTHLFIASPTISGRSFFLSTPFPVLIQEYKGRNRGRIFPEVLLVADGTAATSFPRSCQSGRAVPRGCRERKKASLSDEIPP